jgi:hypothetical protein
MKTRVIPTLRNGRSAGLQAAEMKAILKGFSPGLFLNFYAEKPRTLS